ncbi:hypothetical protein ACIQYF_13900 [Pseudomonas sp. NPDC096917]|uniref:hypothetical protein n=1 Tax=Pseudomonas sp. NPDC096917 TaxID=3364483 RepID=UPI00383BEBA8
MTNKPMLSVERELLEELLAAMKEIHSLPAKFYGSTLGDRVREILESAAGPVAIGTLHRDCDERIVFESSGEIHIKDGMKVYSEPAAQRQGEPVACAHEWTDDGEYLLVCTACGVQEDYTQALQLAFELGGTDDGSYHLEAEELCEVIRRYAEQPTPVAVVMPERSSQDYAIEHAEYMAQSADDALAKFQAYGLALLAVDEGGDEGEGELFEAIDTARGDLQKSLVDLRSMVYEFRKRSSRCTSL